MTNQNQDSRIDPASNDFSPEQVINAMGGNAIADVTPPSEADAPEMSEEETIDTMLQLLEMKAVKPVYNVLLKELQGVVDLCKLRADDISKSGSYCADWQLRMQGAALVLDSYLRLFAYAQDTLNSLPIEVRRSIPRLKRIIAESGVDIEVAPIDVTPAPQGTTIDEAMTAPGKPAAQILASAPVPKVTQVSVPVDEKKNHKGYAPRNQRI